MIDCSKYVPCSNIDRETNKILKEHKLNKLILIEGTDCSGKQTQAEMLIAELNNLKIKATKRQYPNYESPTGYIVGAAYLGKPQMGECIFPEGSAFVDPLVAGHFFAADRYSDKFALIKELSENIVVLDRYVESNMAYQAGLLENKKERQNLYNYFNKLEYGLNKLVKPDIRIFIHMPYDYSCMLKSNRAELPDGIESSKNRLILAENAYLEMVGKYKFKKISCIKNTADLSDPKMSDIKTKAEISKEILEYVKKQLKVK